MCHNPVIAQEELGFVDRAGWCPGTFGTTYDHEITDLVNPGDTVNIDYGMQVTSGGMKELPTYCTAYFIRSA